MVPTFTDVAVVSSTLAADWTLDQWRELLGVLRFDEDDDTPKHVHLTVDFYSDGEGDMTTFAHQIGMEVDDSIKALCSCQFTVGMIGFLPGISDLVGIARELTFASSLSTGHCRSRHFCHRRSASGRLDSPNADRLVAVGPHRVDLFRSAC